MKKEVVLTSIFKGCIVIFLFLSFRYVYGQSTDSTPTYWLNTYSEHLRITPEQSVRIQNLQTMLYQTTADDAGIIAKQN